MRRALAAVCAALSFLVLVIAWSSPAMAAAASCSFSITAVAFGNVDVTTNTTFDTTATFSASCTGDANKTVRTCPNINLGTGGSTAGDPRIMLSGSNQLSFNLYQNNARTTVWGSYLWPYSGAYTAPTVNVALGASGAASTTKTIYARVIAGQQTMAAAAYTSSFAGSNVQVAYAYSTVGTCAVIAGTNATAAPFTVTATNLMACSVSATAVDFGTAGVLSSAVDGSGTLSLACTTSAPYSVSLDGGNAVATNPTLRQMAKGAAKITYGLYRDAARSQPWGNTAGVDTASGTGSGLAQTLTVYGRVPAQTTPAPGAYKDTVVVTVTY